MSFGFGLGMGIGRGGPSGPPPVPPGAPTIGTATGGNAQASVTFTAPASAGDMPITSYTVTSSPGGITASGAASPIGVTGLTNGTAYTFTVTATSAAGTGAASAASNSVTPAVPSLLWNPSAKNAGIILSSGNSIATTSPGGVSATQGVRGVKIGGSGAKYYFEVSFGNESTTADTCRAGLATASYALNAKAGDSGNASTISSHGVRYQNGEFGAAISGTKPAAGRLRVFWNGANGNVYYGVNGTIGFGATLASIASGSTTGGIDFFGTGDVYPVFSSDKAPVGGAAGSATLHASPESCLYAPPAGYTYWPTA